MTHDEMIAVIQAHKEGKTIECRMKREPDEWEAITKPSWDFSILEYRVKPEPREWWIAETHTTGNHVFTNKKSADKFASCRTEDELNNVPVFHVREVIEP